MQGERRRTVDETEVVVVGRRERRRRGALREDIDGSMDCPSWIG